MIQFVFIIIGVVFSVLIFRVFPFNLKRKYLIKVIGIAVVNVLITYLLYSMFSLPIAIGGLLVLTALFAYLVTNQEAVDNHVYNEVNEKDKDKEKNEQHVQQPNELNTIHIQLDQDSIDHLVKAVADDGLESLVEKEITPRLKETFTSHEDTQAIKEQDQQENPEVNEHFISKPIGKIKIKGENKVHIEESSEKISKEIELLGEDENRVESFEYNERIEMNGTPSQDELELLFAGSTRKNMLVDEIEDHKEATEYHLPLYDRSLFNEFKSEEVSELDEINKDKQYVDIEANNKQSELKESILKKRTKLFEDIEKDY
ncbi:hypothetical protein BKP37_18775 [Anaerobacillus alkalilacustris]|uniref:Uncharacterized protein n=1 Tax=Anaerobacillus alkalilacustris TaxID=393763 RepID=A0A1S2LDY6_9BACI|nr:APC family permease [Anaerobacillus alkalilacustris]OIJ10576.1 hypothetical protein BKP37_18775 [Anaerobacillus alkalilacustris]